MHFLCIISLFTKFTKKGGDLNARTITWGKHRKFCRFQVRFFIMPHYSPRTVTPPALDWGFVLVPVHCHSHPDPPQSGADADIIWDYYLGAETACTGRHRAHSSYKKKPCTSTNGSFSLLQAECQPIAIHNDKRVQFTKAYTLKKATDDSLVTKSTSYLVLCLVRINKRDKTGTRRQKGT